MTSFSSLPSVGTVAAAGAAGSVATRGGGGEGGVGGPVARALCEDQDDTVIVSSCDVLRGTAEGEQTGDVSVLDKVFIVVIIIIIISFIYNLLS